MRRNSILPRALAALIALALVLPAAAQAPLTQVNPVWPEGARRDSVEGRVALNVQVGPDGRVLNAQPLRVALRHAGTGAPISESSPYVAAFTEASISAVRQWTFNPPSQATWMTIPIHYQMPNGTIEAAKAACAVPSDVRRGASTPGDRTDLFNHWTAPPGGGGQSHPVSAADRPWLECLTQRLSATASSEEVRTYRAAAVATLARL